MKTTGCSRTTWSTIIGIDRDRVSISTGHLNKDDSIGCCITAGGNLEIHIKGIKDISWMVQRTSG